MTDEDNQLKLFVPRDDDGQKDAFATCLAKEMIQFLDIPEKESWHIITAVLTVELERLDMILDRQGILHHDKDQPSSENQGRDGEAATDDEHSHRSHDQSSLTLPITQDSAKNHSSEEISEAAVTGGLRSQTRPQSSEISQDRAVAADKSLNTSVGSIKIRNEPISVSQPEQETGPSRNDENQFEAPSLSQIEDAFDDFSLRRDNVIKQARLGNRAAFSLVVSGGEARNLDSSTGFATASITNSASGQASSISETANSNFDLSSLASALPTTPRTPTMRSNTPRSQQHNDTLSPSSDLLNMRQSAGRVSSSWSAPRTSSQHARDFGIGFFGEQYVVEVLKQHLSDFDVLTHWTSTLRQHAGFPEYPHREITDLTYHDTYGHLSKLLITWTDRTVPRWLQIAAGSFNRDMPTYWLEVKTTTGAWDTPFFVSTAQYERVCLFDLSQHQHLELN
jgi:hypothetical protein